jgi:uncharacterized membrane protein
LFLCCFFLVFSFAPRLARARTGVTLEGWDALALVVLPVANAALGFWGFYCLLSAHAVNWAGPWLAVAFAAFYLLMMRLPERGILRAGPEVLRHVHLAAALVFLTMAIPLKTHERWMTIGWLVEGAVLLWLARQARSRLIKAFALICLVLGLGALLAVNPPAVIVPIFNQRFGTYCVAIAVFAFVAWLAHNTQEDEGAAVLPWRSLAAVAVLVMNALILMAFSWEIHSFWWYLRWHGGGLRGVRDYYRNYQMMRQYAMYAQFSYSALFMLFGAVLLAIGFVRRSAFLRWQALVLLAATIAKVFLVDMSELSQQFRILSFIGLGVVLLCVSFAYQRDWLNLRGRKESNP